MKLCSRCKLWKTRNEYTKSRQNPDGLYCYCTECRKVIRKFEYQNGKKKYAARRRRSRYGITANQFAFLKVKQEDVCAICRNPFTSLKHTHVDHNHETGVVRGILCNSCNIGLGAFKDDIERLSRAASYLKKPHLPIKEYRLFDLDEGNTA